MFRHKNHTEEVTKKTVEIPAVEEKVSAHTTKKDASPEALRELLEKNLKWSQIIYEQNRRINSKLFWQALAGWVRLLIIVIPIILAVIFLPPILTDVWKQYQSVMGQVGVLPTGNNTITVEKLLKLLPLDPAQQEQVKTILK